MLRLGNAVRVFQSTHPSGVRQWNCKTIYKTRDFNPRTPVGCDGYFIALSQAGQVFQSTHPSGVRLTEVSPSPIRSQFQSTHPSGVRLHHTPGRQIHLPISIHAPQWGATGTPLSRPPPGPYFNPRTPVGCDLSAQLPALDLHLFQSTHPSGVRQGSCDCDRIIRDISIHAPQWGATGKSTRRRDSRNFNPRTPVGCDARRDRRLDRAMRISIHAPQWGATAKYTPSMTIREEFQSTHPSGVRPDRMPLCEGLAEISIHAPQWGATVYD